jgi:transposase
MDVFGLSGWKFQNSILTPKGYVVEAELLTHIGTCTHCGSSSLKRNGTKPQSIKDSPVHRQPVTLNFSRQRYLCEDCGRSSLQPLPEVDEEHRTTCRLIEFIKTELLALHQSFVRVANETGLSEKTIRRIFKKYRNQLKEVPPNGAPYCIGLDECHLKKGARATIVDNINRRFLALLDLRNRSMVEEFLRGMPGWENIKVVTMDMHRPYFDAICAVLLYAIVVIDPFHVINMLNRAVNAVRVEKRKAMTRSQRRAVLSDRELLWKNRADLTPQEKADLKLWLRAMPELREAYFLKERFKKLRNSPNTDEGLRRYERWRKRVPQHLLKNYKAFREAVTALDNWKQEIFNWIDYPFDNALAERTNKDIKKLYRDSNGGDLDVIRTKMKAKVYKRSKRASATRRHVPSKGHQPISMAAPSNTAPAQTVAVRRKYFQPLLPLFQTEQEGE